MVYEVARRGSYVGRGRKASEGSGDAGGQGEVSPCGRFSAKPQAGTGRHDGSSSTRCGFHIVAGDLLAVAHVQPAAGERRMIPGLAFDGLEASKFLMSLGMGR